MRGRWRQAAFVAAAAAVPAVAVGWFAHGHGLESASLLVGVLTYFGTLAAPVWRIVGPAFGTTADGTADRAVAALRKAVLADYPAAARLSRVPEPAMPLRWVTVTDRQVVDHWARIRRDRDADAPLDLDGDLDRITEVYDRVPSGRLVILGPGGAGKTVLVMAFARARAAADRDRVPAVFRLATWDPAALSLSEWMVARLEDEHRDLRALDPAGRTLAAALVEDGRVLPILDGLDEIHDDAARAAALTEIGTGRTAADPLLLTCRGAEYRSTVQQAGRVLSAAAVVDLRPLDLPELRDYLVRSTALPDTAGKWAPVLDHLDRDPDRLAVLTNPLMAFLAGASYGDTAADPAELLADRYGDPDALSEHLLAGFVGAAYRPALRPRYTAGQAARALRFLADACPDGDIAWWRLWRAVPPAVRALSWLVVVGLLGIAVIGQQDPAGVGPVSYREMAASWLGAGILLGVIASCCIGIDSMTRRRLIGRRALSSPAAAAGSMTRRVVRSRAPNSAAAAAGSPRPPRAARSDQRVFEVVATGAFAVLLRDYWSEDEISFVAKLIAFVVVCSIAGAVTGSILAEAAALVREPRALELSRARLAIIGTVVSAAAICQAAGWDQAGRVLLLLLGLPALALILGRPHHAGATSTPRSLLRGDRLLVATITGGTAAAVGGVASLADGPAAGLAYAAAAGVGILAMFGLSSASGKFAVVCGWLAVRYRLPLRLPALLADAHERGLLRQAGASYQFRHERLQRHFSGTPASTVHLRQFQR
jgi:NACHT domain